MKTKILLIVSLFFIGITTNAQSSFDKLLLEEAQTAYSNNNYVLCLEKIDELKKRGVKGLVIAHLQIMAASKVTLDYDAIIQLKKDVDFYLKNYDNEDFLLQYKDVYEINKALSSDKYSEGNLAAIKADDYFSKKDYKNAMQWYLKAASLENVYSQSKIGNMYHNGLGVEKNYTEAAKWYSKAANQGDGYSQFQLGYLYIWGNGVEKNPNKGIEWLEKAKLNGYVHAENAILMNYYLLGEEAKKSNDMTKAIEWYTKAADKGAVNAQIALGVMYANGSGVEKNYSEALKWYTLAANKSNTAQHNLGIMYHKGQGVEKDLNKAIAWYTQAVEGGYENNYNLALAYEENGNYSEAYEYFIKEDEFGKLGFYAYEGKVIEQDYIKAFEYWEKAGQKVAIYNLGLAVAYFSGKGVQKDTDKALSLITQVAEKYKARNILKLYMKEDGAFNKKHYPHFSKDEIAFFEWLAKEHNIVFEQ